MLDLYFFNVGHGDSIAINVDNHWGIIDCNKNSYTTEPNVLKFLRAKNVNKLQFICVTHPHRDHFYGIDDIINFYGENIEEFWIYGLGTNNKNETDKKSSLANGLFLFAKLNKRNNLYKTKLKKININAFFNIGSARVRFLNPTNELLEDIRMQSILDTQSSVYNDLSIVMYIEYNGRYIFLPGDIGGDILLKFCNSVSLNSNIVKLSHHGSKPNNPIRVLDKLFVLDSKYAIISSGRKYKLPSKDIVKYLRDELGATVYITKDLNRPQQSNQVDMNIDLGEKGNSCLEGLLQDLEDDKPENININDGYIKISIDDSGNIFENIVPHIV